MQNIINTLYNNVKSTNKLLTTVNKKYPIKKQVNNKLKIILEILL